MDAFDIFKKLTVGAKFKRKEPLNKNQNKAKKLKLDNEINNKSEIQIKEEPIDEAYEELQQSDFEDIEIKEESDESEESPEKEITLLGSLTAAESGKKKKKKKQKVFDEEKQKLLQQEEINRYRNENRISVNGSNCPPPIKEFSELDIGADLIENLKTCGYETPTPIQKQAIPIMLRRRQILGCAPTGSGKTAAFLIPIIHTLKEPQKKGFRAVIVCPTRELAKQTQRECARLAEGRGFRIHVINKINLALTQYGPKSNQKFDILATTPNRLCFLLKQDPPAISLANVEWLIIDEADKLFEEGLRGFREQLDQIMAACTSKQLRIAMFSATQTVAVGKWCKKNMKGMINCTVGIRNAATDLVEQELLFVGNESGKLVAFRNLVRKGLAPPVLVFVQSKDRAQQLFNELIYDGINVDVIHAERSQTQRDNTVRSFREGKVWVLICTELMARGVDFKGVNLVVNYDFPPNAIAYIHRIGRAGRAGRKGKAVTFFTTDDTPNLRSIAQVLRQSGCEVPEFMVAKKKKRSKRERNTVIEREEITTKPKYAREKKEKEKNRFVKALPINEKDTNQDFENNRIDSKEKSMKNKVKKINNSEKKTFKTHPGKPLKKPLGKRKNVEKKKQRVKK